MDDQAATLDSVFRALADPTRRAVVQRLSRGSATVSELAAPFGMSLPSFVQHLAVLENSDLIVTQKRGRIRTCSLHLETFAAAEKWLDELRAQWASRYENLDNLLLKMNGDKHDV